MSMEFELGIDPVPDSAKVPLEIVTFPVKLFVPLNVKVDPPIFAKPAVPLKFPA